MKRRHNFLAALACALFSLTSLARSADEFPSADIAARGLQDVDFPRMQKLARDVYAYEGLHSPLPNGVVFNTVSLIVVTSDGVLVADGQGDVWQTKLMIESIKKLTSKPVKYVVVASDHPDHVGGNAAFKAEYPGVEFISTSASQKKLWNTSTRPAQIVDDERTLKLGRTEIQVLNLGRAHTGGDLAVYLPKSKVLFLGEIYMRGLFPAMRSAYPSEWLAALEKAQAMDVSWYVTGHGFVDDAVTMERDLEVYKQAIAAVIKESKRLHAAGYACVSTKDCAAVEKADWGQYAAWPASANQAPYVIKRIYQEIEGTLDATATSSRSNLIDLWASGKAAFGEYVTQMHRPGEPRSDEPPRYTVQTGLDLAANPLLDYAFLNLEQHYDLESARNVAKGLGSGTPDEAMALLVRIPPISEDGVEVSRARVKELLALGADGVVLPHVRSAEEARTAISFFEGYNVWSPSNPDGDVVAMLLVEDPDVFADLEEIANMPGYSVLACGIGSLTNALGGDREAAEKLNLEVLAHSQRVGMADVITANPESVEMRVKQGFLGLLVYGPKAAETVRLGRAAAGR